MPVLYYNRAASSYGGIIPHLNIIPVLYYNRAASRAGGFHFLAAVPYGWVRLI
jgi:hypothetical protein